MWAPVSAWIGTGFLLSELALAFWRRAKVTSGTSNRDSGSLRLLWVGITASIIAGVILADSGIHPYLPCGWPWPTLGLGVFATGTLLRWWSIQHLGRFFTVHVAVSADHRVVDTGPYRWIRHPSYSGLLLQLAGLGLSLGTWPALAVILIPPVVTLLHRIRIEEAVLAGHLPDSYPTYVARTKKIVPWVY